MPCFFTPINAWRGLYADTFSTSALKFDRGFRFRHLLRKFDNNVLDTKVKELMITSRLDHVLFLARVEDNCQLRKVYKRLLCIFGNVTWNTVFQLQWNCAIFRKSLGTCETKNGNLARRVSPSFIRDTRWIYLFLQNHKFRADRRE